MSFSSLFSSKLLASMNNARDRLPSSSSSSLSISDNPLRYTLETLPGSRKYAFTPAVRAEILSVLYDAFWGPYAHLFVPVNPAGSASGGPGSNVNVTVNLPPHATLAEVQARLRFCGAGEEEPIIPGKVCGHIFRKGECCFRCKECASDDSCVMCSRCFHATDHAGHNISFFIAQAPGGSCDCGDLEAWREPINCPYHPLSPDDDVASFTASLLRIVQTSPKTPGKPVWAQDVPPVKNYPFRVQVPPDLKESMSKTVAYALDFVLNTLDFSPDEPGLPGSEADLRLQPSADPMIKEQYCVVLWNDEKHSFDEVIQLTMQTTGMAKDEASALASRVDELGRDILESGSNTPKLLETARTFAQVELGVTVRRAYDTFREQMCNVIIEWLLDLTRSRLQTDALVLREILAAELLSPRKKDPHLAQLPSVLEQCKVAPDDRDAARIDWLFLYHSKLWKRPRLNLKEMYVSVLSLSNEHKLAVAVRFANIYHRIIDAYLLVDREAETSIKYFALQLFTVPSVAVQIVRQHGIVGRLLSIITAFFTNQITDKRIVHPPNTMAEIDVDAFPFKSKRFMPVFSDLRYLCHNEPVQHLIAHNREFVMQFAKTCQLFMCVNPNKRAANSHVEYETDAWISVFNVTLSLSRVIKVYGEAFAKATVPELVAAISSVVHHILMVCTLSDDRLDRTKFSPIAFHEVEFGPAQGRYEIIHFDVLEGWVSFHHSLHWLLAELFKHVDLLADERLQEVGLRSMRDILMRNASERAILTVIDFPLRVLAMIAQIRTGLWVRNGFAIRGQLLHYRDFMLRELCYDQDLFILQTALVVLDPNTVLVSILDRFQLLGYFSGISVHPAYEDAQLSGMVEEVLYVFITILSEHASAANLPLPVAVRREIVHALAVGPCCFTDLVKRVAERMVDDTCFERVLGEVAIFRSPESTSDGGTYELKDECYDEINPFFYHYTRNKREEVETILLNRLKKKSGRGQVIVPTPLNITQGPFVALSKAYESELLLQIMFYGINNVLAATEAHGGTPPSAEAILDQTLHLVMLAIVERPNAFAQIVAARAFVENKNLVDVVCALEHHDKYKAYRARADWILGQLSQHIPAEIEKKRTVAQIAAPKPVDSDDAKKRAAKARQQAIMAQMKAQQMSFADNFDEEDEEDYEMVDSTEDGPISFGTCIVCQEDLNSTSSAFGTLGLLQPSRMIRRHPLNQGTYSSQGAFFNEILNMPASLDRPSSSPRETTFPPSNAELRNARPASTANLDGFPLSSTRFGLHGSICSHMMHLDCFHVYSLSMRQRHRTQQTRNHPENLSRKEYICPLCKSLGNVILPVALPSKATLSTVPFSDWIRASGISILKSKPDPIMDSLQAKTGTGEFVFWAAQDPGYQSYPRHHDRLDNGEHKIVDTMIVTSKMISQQTRHLRDRPEPEQGERGAGLYLPEELIGYTISVLETAQRGIGGPDSLVADGLTDTQMKTIRGMVAALSKLSALSFKGRPDEGREAVRQAIIKRLLPEWSRTSHTAFSYPLLLRDPFTLLVETAAIDPGMLRHILVLTYYACLARSVIGIVHVLHKTRSFYASATAQRQYEALFGDVRMFFMSVVRHSPVFESSASMVFKTFGEAQIEKVLYAFTLPFLRRALILCRSILPHAFPTPSFGAEEPCEYSRLLATLGIPPMSDLPHQDALQNALAGWCAHYGHLHAASQSIATVLFDYPAVYRIAKLPIVLDNLFEEKALMCSRCHTSPIDPVICLICGAVCCMQSHCCMDQEMQRGECNMHTRECGGAIGIYFCVKRCQLLYLYAGNGSFAPSPYLDAHGEADPSMRRGRRQFLHPARWEEVRKTWLSHGIPTLVARKLESTVDSGGWESL